MQTVVCISIRESMPDAIKISTKYKIDILDQNRRYYEKNIRI